MGEAGRNTIIPSAQDPATCVGEDAPHLTLNTGRPRGEQTSDAKHYFIKWGSRHVALFKMDSIWASGPTQPGGLTAS